MTRPAWKRAQDQQQFRLWQGAGYYNYERIKREEAARIATRISQAGAGYQPRQTHAASSAAREFKVESVSFEMFSAHPEQAARLYADLLVQTPSQDGDLWSVAVNECVELVFYPLPEGSSAPFTSLTVRVSSVEAASQTIIARGGWLLGHHHEGDVRWRVMSDNEGREIWLH
jgi:hypothetical protein